MINKKSNIMKKVRRFIILALLLVPISFVSEAQSRLTIDDNTGVLNSEVENLITLRLKNDQLEYTTLIDLKNKCDYYFATLTLSQGNLMLEIKDCKDRLLGRKNIGQTVLSASDDEKGLIIYFALSDLIKNPVKEAPTTEPEMTEPEEQLYKPVNSSHHQSRYFFAPSAYNLEEGELYYNSIYFFVHDVQYGLSENFSLGMGTSIIGFPFYLTPKATFRLNEKTRLAIGDVLILGTWNANFFGNLAYGTLTSGTIENNISLGGGYLYTNDGELTLTSHSPVLNFSALGKMSDHIFFLTENYMSRFKSKQYADYNYYNNMTGDFTYYSEDFSQNTFFIYGMMGFRFINRKKDIVSWQIGLSYIYANKSEIPDKYSAPNWYPNSTEGPEFYTVPVIGYTRKFATKY